LKQTTTLYVSEKLIVLFSLFLFFLLPSYIKCPSFVNAAVYFSVSLFHLAITRYSQNSNIFLVLHNT